jgi:hypothetical protein
MLDVDTPDTDFGEVSPLRTLIAKGKDFSCKLKDILSLPDTKLD